MTIKTAIKNIKKYREYRQTANPEFQIAPSTLTKSLTTIIEYYEKTSNTTSVQNRRLPDKRTS